MNSKASSNAYADVMYKGDTACFAYTGKNGGDHQTGVCTAILNMEANDQVRHLVSTIWSPTQNRNK